MFSQDGGRSRCHPKIRMSALAIFFFVLSVILNDLDITLALYYHSLDSFIAYC